MFLANNNVVPPYSWLHDSTLKDINGNTVAMYLAYNNIDIPDIWYHNYQTRNSSDSTLAMIYA